LQARRLPWMASSVSKSSFVNASYLSRIEARTFFNISGVTSRIPCSLACSAVLRKTSPSSGLGVEFPASMHQTKTQRLDFRKDRDVPCIPDQFSTSVQITETYHNDGQEYQDERNAVLPAIDCTAQPEVEGHMKKGKCMAVLFATGLALVPGIGLAQVVQPAASRTAATPAAIPADQQATKEQLTQLFELMRIREQVASLTKLLPALMQQQMTAQIKQMQQSNPELAPVTPQQQQAIASFTSKFMERALDLYKLDEMIADMTGLYQKYMTRSDLDGIIAFYSSSAGQHLLDMQPLIMQEYLPLVMQRMQDRIQTLTDEMRKEMMEIIKSKAPPVNKPEHE
jgi:hypothetical protein